MLKLPERLTHDQAMAALGRLTAEMDALPVGAAVVVDGSALRYFDSSALGLLLGCRRHAQARQQHLTTQAMPARLTRLAGLYGLSTCV